MIVVYYNLYVYIAPAIATINDIIEGTIGIRQVRLLQYQFPSEGMTLKVDINWGQLQVYGSFSIRNPTVLTADFSVQNTSQGIDYFISPELYARSSTGINKRQASTNSPVNLYLSLTGLQNNTEFFLNTTFGDTSDAMGIYMYIIIVTFDILLYRVQYCEFSFSCDAGFASNTSFE